MDSMNRSKFTITYDEHIKGIVPPKGYLVRPTGIYRINGPDDNDLQKLSTTPIVAVAYIRDFNQAGWKILLRGIDLDGNLMEAAFDRAIFLEGVKIIKELVGLGFGCIVGQEKKLVSYLNGFEPTQRIRCVDRLGWHEDANGKKIFVLATDAIGNENGEPVEYHPGDNASALTYMKPSGTIDQWKDNVASKVKGNPLLVFGLSVAFVSPLLKLLGVEPVGFHIHGLSSRGKTTLLQIAATPWGSGAIPGNTTEGTYLYNWNTTSNAVEVLASSRNDMILLLDEIGQCDSPNFKKFAYDIAGGQGKSRMTKDIRLGNTQRWRTCLLSTGEESAQQKMEEGGGKAKAGQRLRIMDIPISDHEIILDPQGKAPADFVDEIKSCCGAYYGTAGPEFVRTLIDLLEQVPDLKKNLEYFKYQLIPSELEPEQKRALSHLALVWLAGDLAAEWGLLPIDAHEIEVSIKHIRDIWLKANSRLSDAACRVRDIRDFISCNESRFQGLNEYLNPVNRCVGRIYQLHRGGKLYLFNDAGFEEVCQGVSPTAVCHELKKLDLLHMNNSPKTKSRFYDKREKQAYYAVKASILEYPFDSEDGDVVNF